MVDTKIQAWIKKCEGYDSHSYIDTTGNLTIGYGRNLVNGISLDEAELMFQNDLKRTIAQLEQYSWYLMQPDNVKSALINMNFNLGIHRLLGFGKMIEALIHRDYANAALEALNSKWAHQVGDRAKDVALMIRNKDDLATGTDFANQFC